METEFQLNWRIGKDTGAFIAKVASNFASTITLAAKGRTASAKSPADIMRLGPPDSKEGGRYTGAGLPAGTKVRLAVTGSDAPEALKELWQLFTCGPRFDHCPYDRCQDTPMLVGFSPTVVQYNCTYSHSHNWQIARKDNDVPPLYLSTAEGACPWPGRECLTDRERILIESRTIGELFEATGTVEGDLDPILGWLEYLTDDWNKLHAPDKLMIRGAPGSSSHKRLLRTSSHYAKAVQWPGALPKNEAIIESWRWLAN